jgi:hypothetical protein
VFHQIAAPRRGVAGASRVFASMRANTGDVRTGIRGRIVGVLGLVRTPRSCTVLTSCAVRVALPSRAESLRLNRGPSAEQTAACIVSGGTAGQVLRLVRTPRTVPPLEVLSGPSALPSRAESLRLTRLRASADMEGGRALRGCVLVDIDAAASSRRASSATTSQGTTTEFMTHDKHHNANTYTSAATVAHVLCGMRGNSYISVSALESTRYAGMRCAGLIHLSTAFGAIKYEHM